MEIDFNLKKEIRKSKHTVQNAQQCTNGRFVISFAKSH